MIQITLTVTLTQLAAITKLLQDTSSDSQSSTSEPKQLKQDEVLVEDLEELAELPIASGSNTKMPPFGRSIEQIKEFTDSEAIRLQKKEQDNKDKQLKAAKRNEIEAKEAATIQSIKDTIDTVIGPIGKPPWQPTTK